MLSEAEIRAKQLAQELSEFLDQCSIKIKALNSEISHPDEIGYKKTQGNKGEELEIVYKDKIPAFDNREDLEGASWPTGSINLLGDSNRAPYFHQQECQKQIRDFYVKKIGNFFRQLFVGQEAVIGADAMEKYLSRKSPSEFLEYITKWSMSIRKKPQCDKEQKHKSEESLLAARLAATQSAFSSSSSASSSSSSNNYELLSSPIQTKLDQLAQEKSFSEFLKQCSTKIKNLNSQIDHPYQIGVKKTQGEEGEEEELYYKGPEYFAELAFGSNGCIDWSDKPLGLSGLAPYQHSQEIIKDFYVQKIRDFLKNKLSVEQNAAVKNSLFKMDASEFLKYITELSNRKESQYDKEQECESEEYLLAARLAATQLAFTSSSSCSSSSSSSSSSELLSSPASSSSESSSATPVLPGYALEQTQTQQPLPTSSIENPKEEEDRGRKMTHSS